MVSPGTQAQVTGMWLAVDTFAMVTAAGTSVVVHRGDVVNDGDPRLVAGKWRAVTPTDLSDQAIHPGDRPVSW